MRVVNPTALAARYLEDSRQQVALLEKPPKVVGFIASDDAPSVAYANATRKVFTEAGFNYELVKVARLELESAIVRANEDASVNGIFIYFPVFNNSEDDYLRNLVDYTKDIEAGSLYWTRKLTQNDRFSTLNGQRLKALLPCTPLAIVKILDDIEAYGGGTRPIKEKTVSIFNRSEVIGRPLAVMMSNDGARVYSFDEHGPLMFRDGTPEETTVSRTEALAASDIVITGVPQPSFNLVTADEVRSDSVCVNFSSVQNFADKIEQHVATFVPRVGPMTVAMCMRNTIRLFENFHQ